MTAQLTATTLDEQPALATDLSHLQRISWPPFMLADSPGMRLLGHLGRQFAPFQFVLRDDAGAAVAYGNSIPFVWDGTPAGLPAGWDAVIERGVADHAAGRAPNTLSALAAVVHPELRGTGLSAEVLLTMRSIAAAHGLGALVAPVRPTLKSRYPLTPIAQYAAWVRDDGLPFDPWMRIHARLSARILGPAPASMMISGTVAEWERWSDMALPASGSYVVPGALAPLTVDRERDWAVYVEPNVWMLHPVQPSQRRFQ